MIYRIFVAPRAEREIRRATAWWERNRHAARYAVEDELRSVFELLQQFPYAGEVVPATRTPGVRRLPIERIRYHIYYVASEDDRTIEVVAFWHSSRGRGPRL